MDDQTRRGIRLRELRKAHGLTQEDLAARSGLSVDTLSAMENGADTKPRLETLESLAAAFAMPVAQFLARLDDPDDTPRAALLRDITTLCAQLDDRALELVKAQVGAVVGWVLRQTRTEV
ncbi:MAG: hypothetical protein RLY86_1943 [Pseudomonadota bacterium]